MNARVLLATLGLLALVSRASLAEGLNLSWVDCTSSPRATDNMDFNCADESSVFQVVGSFIPPSGIDRLSGEEATLSFVTDRQYLPDWWQLGDGACRGSSVSYSYQAPGLNACQNYWGSNAGGGVSPWDYSRPGRGVIHVLYARPQPFSSVSSGREYYAFVITLTSDGAGRCAGCQEGACLILDQLILSQANVELQQPGTDYLMTRAATRNYVSWQGGAAACQAAGARGSKRSTWSQIKGIYH